MGRKTMIATMAVIQKLKQKNLIGKEADEFQILPPDPDKRIILVHVHPKYLLEYQASEQRKIKEMEMNFEQAVLKAKDGAHVRRPSWEEEMHMWWNGKYLVHTHPYFSWQEKDTEQDGYFYVCEKDDALCSDWELAKCG